VALSTANATELTAEQVQKVLVQPLVGRSRFLSAVPESNIIDTAGPLRLPKDGAETDPAWHGQNEQITEVDPDFDEVALLPSTMKSIKTLTRFSNELSRQSVIALDAALKRRLVRDVATKLDKQLFSAAGDGTTTPRGLFAYAGQSITAVGALTLDHLLDAEALVLGADVDPDDNGLRWVMTSREFAKLRKIKQGTGSNAYVVQPDVTKPGRFVLFGYPVIVTNHVADTTGTPNTGNMALVDFSQIVVARDLAPSVKILDQTFGDFDQQAIRVVARYDTAPLNDEAIVKLTGITI
jgi:HK97 family phage major capsid protein